MLGKLKKTKLQKSDQGFTIIEVMIVLAIAGLILLIVFLAVPALQRNARNTSRKSDASNTLAAINTYVSNNNGTAPSSQANITSAIGSAKLGYYTAANVFYSATIPTASTTSGATGTNAIVTTESVSFVPGATCNGNTPTTTGASARAYAVVYEVETGGTPTEQCIAS